MFEQIVFNLSKSGDVRREVLDGEDYLVVPCVMMAEGIWEGSQGPLFYEADEFIKSVTGWDHKPVTVYHPKRNGKPVTAASPDVINNQRCGILLNTKWDGRLATEVWLNVNKTNEIDSSIIADVEAGKILEVSTGMYTNNVKVASEIEHGGRKAKKKATNIRADHLAILPDGVGAYSVADGGGLNVNELHPITNELSLADTHRQICSALEQLHQKPGYYWNGYVADVFRDFFVYRMDGKYYRQEYTVKNNVVSISEDVAEEVVPVTEYRLVANGKFIANTEGVFVSNQERLMSAKSKFDRKTHLQLLENSGFSKEDIESFGRLEDEVLQRIRPIGSVVTENQNPTVPPPPPPPPPPPNPQPAAAKLTFDEILANSDPRTQEMLRDMRGSHEAERSGMIQQIVANTNNQFTQQELDAMSNSQLRKIAALTPTPEGEVANNEEGEQSFVGNFYRPQKRQKGTPHVEEPMGLPVLNLAGPDDDDDSDDSDDD